MAYTENISSALKYNSLKTKNDGKMRNWLSTGPVFVCPIHCDWKEKFIINRKSSAVMTAAGKTDLSKWTLAKTPITNVIR